MVEGVKENCENVAILNKYKDNFDDLIDSLDTEFLDKPKSSNWLGLIDKGICNALKSRCALTNL